MVTIKILGCECETCKKLLSITRKVIDAMGIEAEIIHLTYFDEISAYPILRTPGLVIDEVLVSSGRIPQPKEIQAWLT